MRVLDAEDLADTLTVEVDRATELVGRYDVLHVGVLERSLGGLVHVTDGTQGARIELLLPVEVIPAGIKPKVLSGGPDGEQHLPGVHRQERSRVGGVEPAEDRRIGRFDTHESTAKGIDGPIGSSVDRKVIRDDACGHEVVVRASVHLDVPIHVRRGHVHQTQDGEHVPVQEAEEQCRATLELQQAAFGGRRRALGIATGPNDLLAGGGEDATGVQEAEHDER
mmetsp:Transcript_19142/g.66574  ORF Transcript_19142/g.66574 Transcript_19142/m.66574 type:complete len:223 (+) Transcript_19142:792-1460(+)